jgi:hypothetical protein
MATTAFDIANYTAAFKQVIQPYIQDNVPSQTKLLKVLKKNDSVEFFNNNFFFAVRSNRHGGVVNLSSPTAKLRTGYAPTTQGTVSPKYVTATFDLSDVVMKASQNKVGAVESAMDFQMKTLTTDFSKTLNRQYFSDGVGVLAQVPTSGSVGAGTLAIIYPDSNLDDTRGDISGWYGPINYDLKPSKYFTVGQAIGIGTAAADVGTITAVSGGTAQGTLVVTGGPAINNADAVYLVDGDESAAGTSDIQGIRAALSVGTATTYAGIATSNDIWSPQYMGTASNAALTIADMDTIFTAAYEYAQEGDRYAWFMNRSLYAKYGELLTALRRTVNKTELVSGWSGLAYEAGMGEVGVYLDYDCPDGEAILINLDTWTVCQVEDMGFVQDNLLRRSDYITFQKVFSWYTNLACRCPAANGRMLRRTK